LHKGSLHLDSVVGKGSTFRVTLPLHAPASAPQPTGDTPAPTDHHPFSQAVDVALDSSVHQLEMSGTGPNIAPEASRDGAKSRKATVLVVEDIAEMRRFIVSILQETYNVITAQDGREGLNRA